MPVLQETRRIILIEGDSQIRKAVEAILRSGPYTLLPFANLREAAPALRLREHDAVIASLEWPAPASASAMRSLKRQAGPSPVMLLTSPNRIDAAVRALRHGAADYLIRPPDPVELKTRLQRILDRRDLNSRLA
ncbi:MAG: response regulator, partial [Acidobacteriota bacterium]